MSKIIASINISIDGFCDHTIMIPDDEIHEHYNQLLRSAELLIYGRKTFELMESFWPGVVANPIGNKSMDDFAKLIDDIPKMVFSKSLKSVGWRNSELRNELLVKEIIDLKEKAIRPIFVGSPSLIVALTNLNLIDEYQLCVHPIIVGKGLSLFQNLGEVTQLRLTETKRFSGGAVLNYYERTKQEI